MARLIPSLAWLTSPDVAWQTCMLPVGQLAFGTVLEPLRSYFRQPPTALEFQQWAWEPENGKAVIGLRALCNFVRELSDPLPLVCQQKREEATASVADGNNRLLRALLTKAGSVTVHLGKQVETGPSGRPLMTEAWVPTSTLMELVHHYRIKPTQETKKVYAAAIADMIRYSTAGRYEFVERAINPRNGYDRSLAEEVTMMMPTDIFNPMAHHYGSVLERNGIAIG